MENIKKIFVNLPVRDLQHSMDFFSRLGFSFDPRFTDDKAACLIISEGHIYAMLLRNEFFQGFTRKDVADAGRTTEVLLALEVESREAVSQMIKKAVDAGGTTYMEPQDHGWMYQHCFSDPDGHQWEVFYGDESRIPESVKPGEDLGRS